MMVPEEEAPVNYVPVVVVIRRVRALIGITGRKACAGGCARQMKDVVACDKLRGASKQALIRRFPNGETRPFGSSLTEYIGV